MTSRASFQMNEILTYGKHRSKELFALFHVIEHTITLWMGLVLLWQANVRLDRWILSQPTSRLASSQWPNIVKVTILFGTDSLLDSVYGYSVTKTCQRYVSQHFPCQMQKYLKSIWWRPLCKAECGITEAAALVLHIVSFAEKQEVTD